MKNQKQESPSSMFRFIVEGQPQVKQRPRFARVGNYVKTYTPQDTIEYENWIRLCYKQQIGEMAFEKDRPLSIEIEAYYQIPQSWSMKKKEQAMRNEIKPINSKDVDNTAKVVMDALNGIAYKDDHLITDLSIKKRFDNIPRIEITMKEIRDEEH